MSEEYVTISYEEPCPAEIVKEESILYDYDGNETDFYSNTHDDGEVNSFEAVFLCPDYDICVPDVSAVDPLAVKEEDETGQVVGCEMKSQFHHFVFQDSKLKVQRHQFLILWLLQPVWHHSNTLQLFAGETSQNARKHGKIGSNQFQCEVCDKVLTSAQGLTRHLMVHSGEKPYECEICNKCFMNSSKLTVHMRRHTGDKPFKCEVCDKCYPCSYELNAHRWKHSSEKPFKCEICNKGYLQAWGLTIHRRTHTGVKPFECDLCNKCFKTSTELDRHRWRHIRSKPLLCEDCHDCSHQN